MSVTVVACIYGTGYDRFVDEWAAAIAALAPAPADVLVLSDRPRDIPGARVEVVTGCGWQYPQAFYQHRAFRLVETPWAWIVDIDNLALPDGLAGIESVESDVWLMGYRIPGQPAYVPPSLSVDEYLGEMKNPYPAGSAIRTDAYRRVGGFADVAHEDWALWRRLACAGCTFEVSGRAHYLYRRHAGTRTVTELTPDKRADHDREMLESEAV